MKEKTKKMPDDLYECYLLSIKESGKEFLQFLVTRTEKRNFLKSHKPIPREHFELAMSAMELKERDEFEQELRTPYEKRKEKIRQALKEYVLAQKFGGVLPKKGRLQ